jgi:DNA-binding MarR family transcriptional regulator
MCQLFPYNELMTEWLDDHQQRIWRSWLKLNRELPSALGRAMQACGELSMADFEVLVNLTDVPEGRLRVTELADSMQWERSRVSHQLKRMEARGLVDRAGCPEDGRGSFIGITASGRRAIEQAAPDHVETVRRLVIDVLTPEELDALGAITDKLRARLANGAS